MRKKGAKSEFKYERDRELLSRFREILHDSRGVSLGEMYGMAARCRSSRFWVSEERVLAVLRGLPDTDPQLGEMNPERIRMFREIERRVRAMMAADPQVTLREAVNRTVNSPAPEFYLTDKTAKVLIYEARRRARAIAAIHTVTMKK